MSLGENRKMDFNHGTRKQDLWQQRYNSLDHNQNAMSQNHQNALGKIALVPDKGYSAPLAAMRQGSMGKLAVFEERLADRDFLVKTTFGQGDQMLARAQASLALAGYDLGDYGVKGVDGIMGPKSEKAIKEFQAALGLEPTGKVDLETMKALDLVMAKGVMKEEIEALSKPHEQKPIGDRPVQELNQEAQKRIAERDHLIKPELQGDKVAKCQASLKLAGYDLGKTGVDGKLGPKTAKAIKEFQREHGLKPTGQLDVETLKALEKATVEGEKKIGPQNLSNIFRKYDSFISKEAERLKIDKNILYAVMLAESGGRSFENGKPIIRFEAHKFDQYTKNKFSDSFSYNKKEKWKQQKVKLEDGSWEYIHDRGQSQEWKVFLMAYKKNPEAALKAISIGVGQIMGSNFKAAGYSSPKEMFEAFCKSEELQIKGMLKFIENNPGMLNALQNNNLTEFVRRYNGPGQVNNYLRTLNNYLKILNE